MEIEGAPSEDEVASRFEDLTVDDDLPILERVVRYIGSQVALQRLVHVKMLAETAELVGQEGTQNELIPAIQPLLKDAETVIRQHVAGQLLPLCIVCMIDLQGARVKDLLENPVRPKKYYQRGYEVVTSTMVTYLNTLVSDPELDVRRAAADSLTGLALQIQADDVPAFCLPIPLRLALNKPGAHPSIPSSSSASSGGGGGAGGGKKKNDAEQQMEEIRVTAANLLAEMGGAASEHKEIRSQASWVSEQILPAVLDLCQDAGFRVRRSAIQALPRILGACTVEDAAERILPAFERLSRDELHRVRKSAGECLVDMSRAMMILAANVDDDEDDRETLFQLRRDVLLPIADRLIQDQHKMVRQGMMQFLGPFVASFYPYQYSPLHSILPASTESDGSNHLGIAAQFFPHATSMVSRLNSSHNAVGTAPTPVHASLESLFPVPATDWARLLQALPPFVHASRMSTLSLQAVTAHRVEFPPDEQDLAAISESLLDYFAALAVVATGDVNTDAEMRVYCAYSFPAIVLLMGPENWEGSIKTCFNTLLNPNYGKEDGDGEGADVIQPPLPVKRCLASSLHTVAHVLGPQLAAADILPVVQEYFLRDTDDSVRSNMIRNFPTFLKLLPVEDRVEPFVLWSHVVHGDEFLGAHKKRSVTNPLVLNWRQRDSLARSLVDLIALVDINLVREHIWPIIKQLLTDSINVVREDALWTVPILLQAFCVSSVQQNWPKVKNAKAICTEVIKEIASWLHETVLKLNNNNNGSDNGRPSSRNSTTKVATFSDRQLYCRICGATGLALRFSREGAALARAASASTDPKRRKNTDPVAALSEKVKSYFEGADEESGPYRRMSTDEEAHLKQILLNDLLPPALDMMEDRVSNVRITLMRALLLMPSDVRAHSAVHPVLKELVEESETWESFGSEESEAYMQILNAKPGEPPAVEPIKPEPVSTGQSNSPSTETAKASKISEQTKSHQKSAKSAPKAPKSPVKVTKSSAPPPSKSPAKVTKKVAKEKKASAGPVDVDLTPNSSYDEDGPSSSSSESVPDDDVPAKPVAKKKPAAKAKAQSPAAPPSPTKSTAEQDDSSSQHEDEEKPSGQAAAVAAAASAGALRTVVFEAGPIGMQLEPTREDRACRVYGFLDSAPNVPSPARASNKIQIGDVILKVNGVTVSSYDETIKLLKSGGRRTITFRPGTEDDDDEDEDSGDYSGEGDEDAEKEEESAAEVARERERKAHEEAKKKKKETEAAAAAAAKKVPKEAKKVKKSKKDEKPAKKDKDKDKGDDKAAKKAKKKKKEKD